MATTPNMNKSLSDIFDVELTTTDKSIDELKINAKVDSIDSLEAQRDYVKKGIISLIEKTTKSFEEMTVIAASTEAGKDYQVVGELLKTLVTAHMTLLESEVAHKKPVEVTNNGQITNNNSVFVGSTAELAKYLKNNSISDSVEIPK